MSWLLLTADGMRPVISWKMNHSALFPLRLPSAVARNSHKKPPISWVWPYNFQGRDHMPEHAISLSRHCDWSK
jgi:hypothetical protein